MNDMPTELEQALADHADAASVFSSASSAQQREHIKYVAEAKKPETRVRRANRVIMMVSSAQNPSIYSLSNTPKVLGLTEVMRTRVIRPPDDYGKIVLNWEFRHPVENNIDKIDFAHVFLRSQLDMLEWLPVLKGQLVSSGMIWASWAKKSSGMQTDVSDSDVRQFAIEIGLVDIKVCAVSSIWSGLKLVIPVKDRV